MDVQEVLKISKERKERTRVVTKKILENIHKKIKYYAQMKKDTCVYVVPPIVNDFPLYDLDTVIKDLFKTLDKEGYICTAYSDGRLEICWNEQLVKQKVKTDAFTLSQEEKRLKNITKKNKSVDKRFEFLANPKKTNAPKTLDDEIQEQIDKVLKQKERQQKKFANLLKN